MTEEDRLIDLETRLSYQDESLRVLSDTVARQQQQIDHLESLVRQVLDRLKVQNQGLPPNAPEDEVPPHY